MKPVLRVLTHSNASLVKECIICGYVNIKKRFVARWSYSIHWCKLLVSKVGGVHGHGCPGKSAIIQENLPIDLFFVGWTIWSWGGELLARPYGWSYSELPFLIILDPSLRIQQNFLLWAS